MSNTLRYKVPKINRTYCAVYGCISNNIKNPDHSFFSIPTNDEIRLRWLQVMARMDIVNSYRYHRVCEEHFQPQDILVKSTRRLLKKNCIPTLKLPVTSAIAQTSEEVEIKQEIDDSFSVHEEDIIGALENRKRQNESDPLGEPSEKIIKEDIPDPDLLSLDHSQKIVSSDMIEEMQKSRDYGMSQLGENELDTTQPERITEASEFNFKPESKELPDIPSGSMLKDLSSVHTKKNRRDKEIIPIDFMKSMISSQEEILSILKSQVLLENPDPNLLTFLRLVGLKLSRLMPPERTKMQNVIIKILDK